MESDNKDGHMKDKNEIAKESNDTSKKDDHLNVLLDDNDANFLAGFDIVDDDDWEDNDKSTDKALHKGNKNEHDKKVSKLQVKASDGGRHVNRSSNNITSKSVISKRSSDSIKNSRDNDKKPDESGTRKNLKDRDVESHKKKDEDNKKTSKDRARSSVTSSSVSFKRKRTSSSPRQGEGAKKVSSQRKSSPHSSSRRDKDKDQTIPKEGGSAKKVSPQRKESPHSSSRCDKSVRDSKSDSKSKLSQTRKVDEEHHKKLRESEKRRSIERSSVNIKHNRKSEQSGDKAARKSSNIESVSDRTREPKKTQRDVERHKDTHESEESKKKHHNERDTVRRISMSPKRKRRSRSPIRGKSTEKNLSRPRENYSRNKRPLIRTSIAGRDRNMGKNSSRLKQNQLRKTSPLIKTIIRGRPTRTPVSSLKSRIPYSRRQYSPSASRVSPLRKNMTIAEKLHRGKRRPAGPPKSLRHESESLLQEIIHKLNDTQSMRLQPVMMVPVPQMSEPHSQQNLLYLPPFMKSTSNVTIPPGAPAISLRPDRVVATTALNPYQHEQAYQSQNEPFFGSGSTSFHQGSPIPNSHGFSSQRLQTMSNQGLTPTTGKIDSHGSKFPRDQPLDSRSGGIPKQVSGSAIQDKLLIRSSKLYGHYLGLSKRSGGPDMSDNSLSHPSSPALQDLRSVKRVPEYSPLPPGAVSAARGDNWFGRSSTTHRHDSSTRNRMMNCSRCGTGGVATRDCPCGIPVSSPAHMGRKLSRN